MDEKMIRGMAIWNALFLTFAVVLFAYPTPAQGFKGIVPLESTCEDVKRILKVEECKFPQSIYFLPEYWITVNFKSEEPCNTNRWCYRVPSGRVTSLDVSYLKGIPIAEFEYELKYDEGPFGDIDTVSYKNSEKGVGVLTNNGLINTGLFYPTPAQHKKYAYECPCKKTRTR